MRRPPQVLLVILAVWLGVGAWVLRFGMPMNAITFVTIEVTGRIVESGSGEAVCDAWVLVIPSREWAENTDRLAEANRGARRWHELNNNEVVERGPGLRGPFGAGGDVTAATGEFKVEVTHSWSQWLSGLLAPRKPLPARYRTGALVIEIEGKPRLILDAPKGTWTEHDDRPMPHATYELGTVMVDTTP